MNGKNMTIRQPVLADAPALAAVEAICFPPAEAAPLSQFEGRLAIYSRHFWLLEQEGELVGFIGGMVTNSPVITDEMYEDPSLHEPDGDWQAVFGLDVLPQWRRQGCAALLMETLIADARQAGRKGCILTCKEHLIHYYARFGYENLGISQSVHGGAVWYDMRLTF